MKTSIILMSSLLYLLSACSQQNDGSYSEYDEEYGYEEYDNANANYNETLTDGPGENKYQDDYQKQTSNNGGDKVILHTFKDKQSGMTTSQMPLPASWKHNPNPGKNQPGYTGPGGLKIYDIPFKFFNNPSDPYVRQAYQQSGQALRAPMSLQAVIQQDFVPMARQQGLKLVKQYQLPELIKADRNFDSKLWKFAPANQSFDVVATEWQDQQGNPSLIIIHQSITQDQNGSYWGYYANMMETSPQYFETAKKALIYGQANVKYNNQWIAAYNQREQQKSNSSMAAHNQKMRNNQSQFDQQQRTFRETNDAINNSIMSTYRTQSESSDRIQEGFTDYIRDEQNIYDPNSGQTYKVDAGANQYWTNDNGEYIQSNDYNYNPNLDQNTNNYNWTEAETDY